MSVQFEPRDVLDAESVQAEPPGVLTADSDQSELLGVLVVESGGARFSSPTTVRAIACGLGGVLVLWTELAPGLLTALEFDNGLGSGLLCTGDSADDATSEAPDVLAVERGSSGIAGVLAVESGWTFCFCLANW